jgi:endonuclease/exonuclease/phosphatase family metal-dependent hydrolase
MTYNVLNNTADGALVGTERIAPWSQRVLGAVDLIRRGNPDFIALQEAWGWLGAVKGPKQVDDLVARLGGTYALARTEATPGEPGWYRTGRYILYRSSVYETVGNGWHWNLARNRFAAFQVFRHKTTGARVLVISVHLSSAPGATGDAYRQEEMTNLMNYARQEAGRHGGIPVVVAGDTNSHDGSNHPFDGPGNATRAVKVADAFKVARTRSYYHINSANQYMRTPPMDGRSIDRVFTSPGVGIRTWRVLANMSGTRMVGVIPSDHNPVQVDVTVPY